MKAQTVIKLAFAAVLTLAAAAVTVAASHSQEAAACTPGYDC